MTGRFFCKCRPGRTPNPNPPRRAPTLRDPRERTTEKPKLHELRCNVVGLSVSRRTRFLNYVFLFSTAYGSTDYTCYILTPGVRITAFERRVTFDVSPVL